MYLSYIDGIRAFAVLSVFIYHLERHWLPGGFCGVDVFFVVSGYVVSLSLDKQKGLKFINFLALFYARRIKRILPALVFCLLVTIFFTNLFIPDSYPSIAHKKTAFYAFFGLSNFILAAKGNDYFGPIAEFNPFTHTWSLGVEEQFYVIFPFIFIIWASGKQTYSRKLAAVIFFLLFLVSLVFCYWHSQTNKLYEYYLISSRFWQLASGILLYLFTKSFLEAKVRPWKRLFPILSWLGLAIVLASFVVSDAKMFPMPWAFLSVVGTLLLLFSMHYLESGLVRKLLEHKFLTFIGKISYSLYLWHWPVIVLFQWTVGLNSLPKYLAVVAITFAMAIFSYYYIETPIRSHPLIAGFSRRQVIITGLVLLLIFANFGRSMFKHKELFSLSSVVQNQQDWYSDRYELPASSNPDQLTVSRSDFLGGLKLEYRPQTNNATKNLYVLGDSHALAYNALVKRWASETGQNVTLYSMPGCGDTINKSFAYTEPDLHPFLAMWPACSNFLSGALDEVELLAQPNDTLLLAALKLPRFTEQWAQHDIEQAKALMSSTQAQAVREHAIPENVERLRPLTQKGVQVVFEAPKPIFKNNPFRCADWFNTGNPLCEDGLEIERPELLAYREPVMRSLETIASQLENTRVFDPLEALCPNSTCRAFDKDKPLFFDGDHLSAHGNMVIYGALSSLLATEAPSSTGL